MKRSIISITLCCFCATVMYGAVITGTVKDEGGEPLAGASISLSVGNDSIPMEGATADVDGNFQIKSVKPGLYSLKVSMVGMDPVYRTLKLEDADGQYDAGEIKLTEASVTLKEAVVTATKAAVVAKQDTLEFNAGSYRTMQNATVEDLLKKLPGVEVGSDGKITSNGKSVTKVLVDGKEFFGEDTKMATKNLPSELVDKVQVVDRKSDFSRLTGVDDGEEETVINLTVRKSMKNGWFGTVEGGYGTDHRYMGSFNISTFTDNNQISIVGGANNINDLGFMDGGRGRFRSFGPQGGITDSQRFGINFNLGKTEKFRIGGNVFYSHSDSKVDSRTETQYLFPDSISTKSQGSKSRDRGHNVNANFRMEWKIDDYNTIDFRPNFSFNFRNAELTDTSTLRAGDVLKSLVNRNNNIKFNKGTSWNASGDLIYNHKFKSHQGRSFSLRAQYNFSDTRQRTTSWNDILYYMENEESETLYQFIRDHEWSNNVTGTATWTEPLGDVAKGNFLQAEYRIQMRFNNSDKSTYDIGLPDDPDSFIPEALGGVPADGVFNPEVSNSFRNRFINHQLKLGYKKVNKKLNLEIGLAVSPSSSKSTDLINSERNIPQRTVWNFAPYARLRLKFSKTESMMLRYNARTSQPSMSQLQPVAEVSNPLNITIGNPDLKPTFTQSLNFHYNNYNQDAQRTLMCMLHAQYATNVIVANTTTDPATGARTTRYANANGNMNLFTGCMINQPFTNRHWRYSVNMMARYASNAGYINGNFNRTGNLNLTPRLGVTYSCDVFQMSVNPTYSFGMTTNTLKQQKNQYTHTYGFNADAQLTLPFGLSLSTDLSFDRSTGYTAGFDNDSWLWNAQASYSILKDKSLTFTVRAYDLLGMKKNVSRSISANQIVDSRYNDLTRYVMFSVSYTFNTMKNKKRAQEMPAGFDGHPGPPAGPRPGGRGGAPMGPPPGGRPF